jgi:fermentation-respiration switch protein FrsA (DUF1100 family)
MKNEMLTLTQEWDKTFPLSDKVDHKKVTFHNRYGITLVADMYIPKELMIIPDAVHTDLYDGGGKDAIPFDKIEAFYREYLK